MSDVKPETEIHVYEGGELVGIYVGEMKRAVSWARRANPDASLRTMKGEAK